MKILFSRHVLSNGLRVIFHHDKNSPLAAVNVLYDVGAKDENPERTGFAHLFEHLMFGGSKNIPAYDTPLQQAGGENNAFTSNDITNYYITLPKENIETAFWLESDRMLELDFSERSLDVQRKVVVEEFNQRYLNQPYGDVSLLLRPLCYKVHPYQWSTIGKDISHIEGATLKEVKEFYFTHYNPQNAILAVTGDFDEEKVFQLTEKWFGDIHKEHRYIRNLIPEPVQTESRRLEVERDVPQHLIIISFPMSKRLDPDYYTWDLISNIFADGKSSRLIQSLVRDKKIFSDIDAYITGSMNEGQFIIRGDVHPGQSIEFAEKSIWTEIEKLKSMEISEDEMKKLINQVESSNIFRNIGILNKAMNLAMFELLGDAEMLNQEILNYRRITAGEIQRLAKEHLIIDRASTLIYKSQHIA